MRNGNYKIAAAIQLLAITLIPACETAIMKERASHSSVIEQENKQSASPEKSGFSERPKKAYAPRVLAKEEAANTERLMVHYYGGLVESIKILDDGVSPADVVGGAAVSENLAALKSWKESSLVQFDNSPLQSEQWVEKMLSRLPSAKHLDEATSLVLRWRNGKMDWPEGVR